MSVRVGLLAVIAALLYNSWPLGYLLNPSVERHALASELQAPHQPYNWVFVLTDVLAGMLMVGVGLYQMKRFQFHHGRLVAICLLLFGALVALAALTPLTCDPTLSACGPLLRSPTILVHGFASIVSVGMLFLALLIALRSALHKHRLSLFSGALIGLLFLWLLFAVAASYEYVYRIKGNALQDYFMTICSFSIIALVLGNEHFMRRITRAQSASDESL